MRVKDQMPLDGDLWKDIKADESGWLIDQEANQRCIIITLIKRDARTLGNSFFFFIFRMLWGYHDGTHGFLRFGSWLACIWSLGQMGLRWPLVISEQSW